MNRSDLTEKTRELLIKHCKTHPELKINDIFKYIFQSSFGCEHSVSDERSALEYIKREYEALIHVAHPLVESLDGEYSRVHLSCLNDGLSPDTLAKMFCLSAKNEPIGKTTLERKLRVAKELVEKGELPFDSGSFKKSVEEWQRMGYPAIHHSNEYREKYRPAYRVIDNRYADLLPILTEIDNRSRKGSLIMAIEGGSASGKTTLADILRQIYDCNVFHMDDFFLRPEQRTPARFAEVGGNVDRERFYDEVLKPLLKNEAVRYRPYDCSAQTLKEQITVYPKKLTVIEGAYSMHTAFGKYYDLSVFLDITPEHQRKRILLRNSPQLATRFFGEWIPFENEYFSATDIKKRTDLVMPVLE